MRKLLLLVPLGLSVLAGCTTYRVSYLDPVPRAVVAAPAYVTGPVVAAAPLIDSDGDGVADVYDRYPSDWRYR
jgi:hypothetical protein